MISAGGRSCRWTADACTWARWCGKWAYVCVCDGRPDLAVSRAKRREGSRSGYAKSDQASSLPSHLHFAAEASTPPRRDTRSASSHMQAIRHAQSKPTANAFGHQLRPRPMGAARNKRCGVGAVVASSACGVSSGPANRRCWWRMQKPSGSCEVNCVVHVSGSGESRVRGKFFAAAVRRSAGLGGLWVGGFGGRV